MESGASVGVNTKVNADVNITPRRSQIFVTLAIGGAICLALVGCALIYAEKNQAWVPFVAAGGLCGAAFWAFKISHTNAEMFNPIPSEVTFSDAGLRVVTDPRLVGHSSFFSSMADVFSALQHLKPLPPADALLDDKGVIIPGSEQAAADQTAKANKQAEQMVADSLSSFSIKVVGTEFPNTDLIPTSDQEASMKNIGSD